VHPVPPAVCDNIVSNRSKDLLCRFPARAPRGVVSHGALLREEVEEDGEGGGGGGGGGTGGSLVPPVKR
jgi:hypothetical protein